MINLINKKYEKQRRKGIKTNEGYVYQNPQDRKKIIKVIEPRIRVPEYLEIKQYTIKQLLDNYEYLKDLNIAIPETMVLIDNQPRGYSANYIKGNLLSCSLRDNNISLETKIDYLKQIGLILRNMSEIRKKHSHLSNFFYNDIHEDNFLVTSQNIVYGVDLDSCSIKDNIPIQALYPLTIERYKLFNSKYKPCNQVCDCTTTIIPNEDLDLFCYITMILNFISGKSLYRWTPNKLDVYLNFLESNGANLEFLYLLSHIYNEEPNINPDYLLDYIKEIYSYGNIYNDKSEELQKILRR